MNNKPTLATLKSFIKNQFKKGNLFSVAKSVFDGMTDCVQESDSLVIKTEKIDFEKRNTLGLKGLWLVGSSRDYISKFENEEMIGFEIHNCCGSSLVLSMK